MVSVGKWSGGNRLQSPSGRISLGRRKDSTWRAVRRRGVRSEVAGEVRKVGGWEENLPVAFCFPVTKEMSPGLMPWI